MNKMSYVAEDYMLLVQNQPQSGFYLINEGDYHDCVRAVMYVDSTITPAYWREIGVWDSSGRVNGLIDDLLGRVYLIVRRSDLEAMRRERLPNPKNLEEVVRAGRFLIFEQ